VRLGGHEPTTAAGRAGLAALLTDPRHALVALDYDGTLAPVVDRPEEAVPQPGAIEVLTELARKVGRVALVTGRPADTVVALAGLEPVPGIVVLGQYGVQRWASGVLSGEPAVPGLALARSELAALALPAGASVEDKGRSLVVHTRQAEDPGAALAELHAPVQRIADAAHLELHSGRLVLELRPPGHDKGRALRSLAEGVSAVLFAGDDRGDLAAFDAVDTLRELGTEGLLVCSDSHEAPQELRDRADLVVDGPAGVVRLLGDLAAEV
jgi:trehalose 6-phosphate phosphatase